MKKKYVVVIGIILFVLLFIAGGTYSYWTWNANNDKNVVFTTAGISDYIIYDEGNSQFIGDFQASSSFCESVNTTVSFYKTAEATTVNLRASIYMDVNSIGSMIASSNSVHWVLTEGDNTISCDNGLSSESVVNTGTFNGVSVGEKVITLASDLEVTLEEKKYTVWIWVDSNGEDIASLSGETVDTNVWTQIDMIEGSSTTTTDFVAPIANSINTSNANVLKSASQTVTLSCTDDVGVTAYYFGKSKNPTGYTSIESTTNMSQTVTVTSDGAYYLVCKDAAGNISTSTPSVVFASYEVQNRLQKIGGGSEYNLTNFDLVSSNTYLILNNTLLSISDSWTLPAGSDTSSYAVSLHSNYEDIPSSGNVTENNTPIINTTNKILVFWFDRLVYTISYDACGGTGIPSSQTKVYGETITISNTTPTRYGYTFVGWSIEDSCSDATSAIYSAGDTYTSNASDTLYAQWQQQTDTTAPTCTISATAGSTTVTASYSDAVGVTGWYFGTTQPSSSTSFTSMTSSTSGTKTGTVAATGTNYFGFKDAAGNIGYCSGNVTAPQKKWYCKIGVNNGDGSCCQNTCSPNYCWNCSESWGGWSYVCSSGTKLSNSYCWS